MAISSFSLSSLVNSLFRSNKKSRSHSGRHRHSGRHHHSGRRICSKCKHYEKKFTRKNMKYKMKGG